VKLPSVGVPLTLADARGRSATDLRVSLTDKDTRNGMNDDEILERWLEDVCTALELSPDLISTRAALLGVARDVAHEVLRPAAPLTTFLVGYAAAQAVAQGDSVVDAVAQAATIASALAVSRHGAPD
jgi:Domain of unknown function (DUF6457)